MLQYKPPSSLAEDDLPYTDDQPVDNELKLLLPTLLRATLGLLWADRQDWFLGVNIGLYYDVTQSAIGPDAFLSLGVARYRQERGRLSYVVAQENRVIPQWLLEIVSQKPGGEYGDKFERYAAIGVLYYVIYNPNHWQRDKHDPFEVYRLEQGQYMRQVGNPVWMAELGLGIGIERGQHEGLEREWLYWYDEIGHRYPAPENVIAQERQLRMQAEQRYLREQALRVEAKQAQLEAEQAQLEAERLARTLILRQLTRRIADIPDHILSQINLLSITQLDALGGALWDFTAIADLIAWLEKSEILS